MLPRLINYLHENPRRLAIRREHPDYFRVQFGVTVAGQTYAAIGNRLLLLAPWPHQNERIPLTRAMCLALNKMAENIVLNAVGTTRR